MNSAQHARDAWIKDFTDELRLRHVEDAHLGDAIRTAEEYLHDSGEPPATAFGNPREYAASLNLPTRDDGIGKTGSFLAILLTGAAFYTFTITATQWAGGNNSTGTIAWCLTAAAVLLASSFGLSLGIARHVVQATIRDRFSGSAAHLWSTWAPWAIVVPWLFPTFAALIAALILLRI